MDRIQKYMETIAGLAMAGELTQACASPTREHSVIRIEPDKRQAPRVDAD